MATDQAGPNDRIGRYDLTGKRVFVAGHRGMVGSAIVRRLARENCSVLTATREEVDLREQGQVRAWLEAGLSQGARP